MKANQFLLLICQLTFGMTMITGCTKPTIDLSKELETLAVLQRAEQAAHMEEQPAVIVNMLADTVCQVKNGEVNYYTKDEMTERFIKYFESVEFIKWEDSHPPVYTLSADGTMAQILIQKHVEVKLESDTASNRETTDFAWTELWRKIDDHWKMYCVTSTGKTVSSLPEN